MNCPEKAMKISRFNPNQSAPSIYIMIELCYFSLNQWEIKIHMLWKKTVLATWLKDLFMWVNPCLCDTWTIKVFFIYLANKRRRRGSCWKKLCSKCFNWLPPKKKSLEARSGFSSLDAKTIFRTIIQLLVILVYLYIIHRCLITPRKSLAPLYNYILYTCLCT